MKIIWLQAFIAVAKFGSFSVAADELYISQSSISKHIHSLEEELGVSVFERNTRNISLSPAGRAIFNRACVICKEYTAMDSELADYRTMANPSIRIASVPIMHLYDLSGVLVNFRQLYPSVDIEMIETDMLGVIKNLESSPNTVGILRECAIRLLPRNIKWQTSSFIEDELICLCSKSHPFARVGSISISDCLNSRMVVLSTGFNEYRLLIEDYGIPASRLQPIIKCASVTTLENYVANNLGVSMITTGMAHTIAKNPNIACVKFSERPNFSLAIVAQTQSVTGEAAALIKMMMENYHSRTG